jgi:P27 family predicted phage terminase small subunit
MSGVAGRSGRRPKPAVLHLIQGTKARLKRAPAGTEALAPGRPTAPPSWLTRSQRRIWRHAVSNAPLGLLRRIDSGLLVTWVIAVDLHREAAAKVAQFGLLTKAPDTGMPMQSPYLAILNRQTVVMIRTAAELGFTPSARAGMSLGDAQPPGHADPALEFFQP